MISRQPWRATPAEAPEPVPAMRVTREEDVERQSMNPGVSVLGNIGGQFNKQF